MMNDNKNRPDFFICAIKIWMCGFILGPLFSFLVTHLFLFLGVRNLISMDPTKMFKIALSLMFVSGILSIPSAVLLTVVLFLLFRFQNKGRGIWLTTLSATAVFTLLPFLFLWAFTGFILGYSGLIMGYLLAVWLGVYLIFRDLPFAQPEDENEILDFD